MSSTLRLIVGGLVPLALLLAAILIPGVGGTVLGVSLKSWCLFACAPITSLLLALVASGNDGSEDGR